MDALGIAVAGLLGVAMAIGITIGLKAKKSGQAVKSVKLSPWSVSYDFYEK